MNALRTSTAFVELVASLRSSRPAVCEVLASPPRRET
jgi:hypothetical protein